VCVVLGIYSGFVGMRSNFTRVPFNARRALRALWVLKWEAAIPVVLLVGIGTGILRIHEASAFTAVYVLIIEVFVYRDISIRKDLPRVCIDSMTLVGAILIILSCGIGFTAWMIQAQVPAHLLEWLETLIGSKFVFLILLNMFLIIVGMLMEIFTAIVVAVPLVVPLAQAYGLDPYHFAIIFLVNLEIAYLMPPLGINLFIASLRFGRPVTYLYRSVLVFIGVLFATLMLICYVPAIVTWLPDQLNVGDDELNFNDIEQPPADDAINLDDDEPAAGAEGAPGDAAEPAPDIPTGEPPPEAPAP
jgi:C4-dicarboxylate transporter DctM subunit